MIYRVAHRELRETIRDGRFRWSVSIILLLILVSFISGWDYLRTAAQHEAIVQSAERERWLDKGEMNPHSAAHYGQYLFKPRLPIESVDPGISPYSGISILVEPHVQNLARYKPAAETATGGRAGRVTVAMTLQILVPLLIVLSLFSTFTSEREQGTLRLLLSLPVSPRRLAIGKVLGAAVPWLLCLVPASVLGAAVLIRSDAALPASDIALRTALFAAAYLLYFLLTILVAVTVSALSGRSRTALACLLAFWFVTGILAPPLAMDIATAKHPVPNGFEFQAAIARDRAELPSLVTRIFEVEERMLEDYGVSSTRDLPLVPSGVALMEDEADNTRIHERHFTRLYDTYEDQTRLFSLLGLGSPLLAVQSLSMGFAGTDFAHQRHFAEAAEQYRRDFVRILNEDDARNGRMYDARQAVGGDLYLAGRDLWKRVPEFTYRPPTVGWTVDRHHVSIAILLSWLMVVSGFLWAALGRVRAS